MTFFHSWDEEIQFGATARNSFVPKQSMELNELFCLSYDPSMENGDPYPEPKAQVFFPESNIPA